MVVVVVALEERRQAFKDVEGLLNLRVDGDVHRLIAVADLDGQVLESLFHRSRLARLVNDLRQQGHYITQCLFVVLKTNVEQIV